MKYPEIHLKQKTGDEPFHVNGEDIGLNLLSFWKWSSSDLINNAMRGILAEYIVASAVQLNDGNRVEWDAFDIETKEGIKVEVKSASYLQSWSQERYSDIKFGIRPTYGWDASENSHSKELKRQSDIYVFCILKHKVQETLDPLDLSQWEFLVLSTETLNQKVGNQKTIGLGRLKRLEPTVSTYALLHENIKKLANQTLHRTR